MTGNDEGRFGERDFAYPGGTNASVRPDRFSAGEGGEAILFDQGGDANRVRGVFYFGSYRTYAQGVSFINFNNTDDFDRAVFLEDVLSELAGYGGTFTGQVISNKYEQPVEGVCVELIECNRTIQTDADGNFILDRIPIETFHIRISKPGHTTIDEIEYTFDGEMEINSVIRLRHPEITLDPNEIHLNINQGNSGNVNFEITNPGDGPLEYNISIRGAMAEGGIWDPIEEVNTCEIKGDGRLQAAVFLHDHFWAVGGQAHDEPNMLYKISRDGDLVESWEQQSYSNYGWRNICSDGEYLYAVDSTYIAQIDPENGQVTGVRYPTGLNPCWAVTYEEENELFWVSSMTTDIFAIDRMGTRFYTVDNDRRFRISGLFIDSEDPDGYNLYVLSNATSDTVELWKVNIENSDAMKVLDLQCSDGEEAGGCNLTDELHPFTRSLLVQMQAQEDWMRIYELSSDFFWVENDPTSGLIEPEGSQQVELSFNAAAPLDVDQTCEAFLQVANNTPLIEPLWIPITMTVTSEYTKQDPANSPFSFGLQDIYPNPFNPSATVVFTLDRSAGINLSLLDISGRKIDVLLQENMTPGRHTLQFSADNLPSGIYLVRLSDGFRIQTRKVTLLK